MRLMADEAIASANMLGIVVFVAAVLICNITICCSRTAPRTDLSQPRVVSSTREPPSLPATSIASTALL